MGPRSDNRGYGRNSVYASRSAFTLQWVRGPITAVMNGNFISAWSQVELQWVRGPITAVMANFDFSTHYAIIASMGPRSANRRYGHLGADLAIIRPASMGPRSDNRGYGRYLNGS